METFRSLAAPSFLLSFLFLALVRVFVFPSFVISSCTFHSIARRGRGKGKGKGKEKATWSFSRVDLASSSLQLTSLSLLSSPSQIIYNHQLVYPSRHVPTQTNLVQPSRKPLGTKTTTAHQNDASHSQPSSFDRAEQVAFQGSSLFGGGTSWNGSGWVVDWERGFLWRSRRCLSTDGPRRMGELNVRLEILLSQQRRSSLEESSCHSDHRPAITFFSLSVRSSSLVLVGSTRESISSSRSSGGSLFKNESKGTKGQLETKRRR
ncbi:hypothetical protein BDY24DRAFT_247121 [Mrakia frigida]|uniref:uncharacterized protein n=1 Tax=Mrakia frigida TaxID=29902 RepID=UPI003FCC20A7